jgi:hypothetical protein
MASGRVRYFNVYRRLDGSYHAGALLESRAAVDAYANIRDLVRVYCIRVTWA